MQTVTRIATLGLLIALTACGNDSAFFGPPPTVDLTAASDSIAPGSSTMLSWSTTEAALCTASGAWSGPKGMTGSESTGPLNTTSTFTLRCDGDGGTATDSVTVTVSGQPPPAPTVTLNANPTTVASGGSTQLTWSSTDANTCTASGGWSGNQQTSGSATINNLTLNTTFTLQCTGAGGSAQRSVTVSVIGAPPPPTVMLSANPTSVNAGGSSILTWSSTNATSCVASGGWSGPKQTSGSQPSGALNATTLFVLACTGTGGTAQQSVTVTVNPVTPAPTVSLSANPSAIIAGNQSVLTWNSSNATACTASGAWTGQKPTNGGETVGPLFQTSTFTLTCTGAGGSASQSATVTVTGGSAGLDGQVDSSFVDIFGGNAVYVFSGNVTPDDIDGDSGDPVLTLPVTQDDNACTFHYATESDLDAGLYTIAFTQDAARDRAGENDDLAFVGTRQIIIATTDVTADIRPGNILQVGPGRQFATLQAASAAATDGSVIEIDAGTYDDDVTVWRQDNVVIRGVGGRAHIRGTRVIAFVSGDDSNNGMGLMVTRGDSIRVENMEFSLARVVDGNGAGIRVLSRDLTVCNSRFHENENGMLGGGGALVVEYSEFDNNGPTGLGFDHNNIYVDAGELFIFRHNYSHRVEIGNLLRTRARENHILYNRLMDETTGNSFYNIDVPEGGLTFIIGNLLQQGPDIADGMMVNYASERLRGGTHELYLVNNTFVNDAGSGGFVQFGDDDDAELVRTINNLFVGDGSQPAGDIVEASSNLVTNAPGLVNQPGFDYHLTATSPARDAGTAPGTARGVSLDPVYQYRDTANREGRVTEGSIDIGAYEFTP